MCTLANSTKKDILERLYTRYSRPELIKPDPLQFVYHYSNPADMEIVALLAACLAYGRVRQIEKNLTDLFCRMAPSPFQFVMHFDSLEREKLKDFKHRFNTGDDISDLLELLRLVLDKHGSIENFFIKGYHRDDENVIPALSAFCDSLWNIYTKKHKTSVPKSLTYLLPKPTSGSACKRLNLFLRWMVRDDNIDTGLWAVTGATKAGPDKTIDKAKLIVPVDVHMARLCKILGFYDNKSVSLAAAIKITRSFAQIEPLDPVKYDFALSRVGILGNCTGRYRPECELCELFECCLKQENWKE